MGAHLGVYFDGVLDSVRLGVYLGGVFIGEDLVIVFHGAEQPVLNVPVGDCTRPALVSESPRRRARAKEQLCHVIGEDLVIVFHGAEQQFSRY